MQDVSFGFQAAASDVAGVPDAQLYRDMMASATARCCGVILSSGISGKRSPVRAKAEPANRRQTAVARSTVFMALSLIVPDLVAGLRAGIVAGRQVFARQIR